MYNDQPRDNQDDPFESFGCDHKKISRWTVYSLVDPRTMSMVYVGMTSKTLGERLYGHKARSNLSSVAERIRSLRAESIEPIAGELYVFLACRCKARKVEQAWIRAMLNKGEPLINIVIDRVYNDIRA